MTEEAFWLLESILTHPHAWCLIDGAAPRDIPRLIMSLANSGIAKVAPDRDRLVASLLALVPDPPLDLDDLMRRIVDAAAAKQLGSALFHEVSYDPRRLGPLPLGYTDRGHYVLLDRSRARVRLAHAHQVLSGQFLEQLAPMSFWLEQFGWRGRLRATSAGEAVMQACLRAGQWEPRRKRPEAMVCQHPRSPFL